MRYLDGGLVPSPRFDGREVYARDMAQDRVWTAAELEQMTPDERAALIRERVVTNVDQVDAGLVERARSQGRDLLEARGALEASQ